MAIGVGCITHLIFRILTIFTYMNLVPGISFYMCRRLKRDNTENVLPGKEKENVKLLLKYIDPQNNEHMTVCVDRGNYTYGINFEIPLFKLRKYMQEYKDWKKIEEERDSERCNEYCVSDFHFHNQFRNSEFGVAQIVAYVVKYRSVNGLREMKEDEEVPIVMGIVNYIRSQHHLISNKDKWDAVREFLRKKHSK